MKTDFALSQKETDQIMALWAEVERLCKLTWICARLGIRTSDFELTVLKN